MARTWKLQDAKNRFSEVVARALQEGPQTVTRHGREAVVILSLADYRKLAGGGTSFKAFLRAAPLASVQLERDPDPGRPVRLP
jgi:prevent-host-death family protein